MLRSPLRAYRVCGRTGFRLGLAKLSSACFPFSNGARRLQRAIEGEVDETLQNVFGKWPSGQEHPQIDGCEDYLNQQVGVRLGTQDSSANPPFNQVPTDVAPFSPEALGRLNNFRGLIDRSHQALQHCLSMV